MYYLNLHRAGRQHFAEPPGQAPGMALPSVCNTTTRGRGKCQSSQLLGEVQPETPRSAKWI